MSSVNEHLYGLIFAGGGGTRLWPLSRNGNPKQFLKLFSDKTLLRETFERVASLIPAERIFVVTMADYVSRVASELPEVPIEQIIAEPERKNTAPAVLLGSIAIQKKDPDAIIANIWSDHQIGKVSEYKKALLTAYDAASDGKYLVATGVAPTFPHTGLGYIKYDGKFEESLGVPVFRAEKFIEKPEFKVAEDLLDEGKCLWNIGLYVWKVPALLDAFQKYSPEVFEHYEALVTGFEKKDSALIAKHYASLPDIPIDKAVTEKVDNLLAVEGQFSWSDIGDFQVLWEQTLNGATDGNSFIGGGKGQVQLINSQGVFVSSDSKQLVVGYGLRNVAVIVTEDVVLVVPRDDAQKVKDIVAALKNERREKFL